MPPGVLGAPKRGGRVAVRPGASQDGTGGESTHHIWRTPTNHRLNPSIPSKALLSATDETSCAGDGWRALGQRKRTDQGFFRRFDRILMYISTSTVNP